MVVKQLPWCFIGAALGIILIFTGCGDGAAGGSAALPDGASSEVQEGALYVTYTVMETAEGRNAPDWLAIRRDGDSFQVKTQSRPTWRSPEQTNKPSSNRMMSSEAESVTYDEGVVKYMSGSRVMSDGFYFEGVMTVSVDLLTETAEVEVKSRSRFGGEWDIDADATSNARAHYSKEHWPQR